MTSTTKFENNEAQRNNVEPFTKAFLLVSLNNIGFLGQDLTNSFCEDGDDDLLYMFLPFVSFGNYTELVKICLC